MPNPKDSQLDLPPKVERWFFCFGDSPERAWWRWFTRPGFRHVYAFRMPCDGVLIALNPCVHRVENGLMFERAYEVICRAQVAGEIVVVYKKLTRKYDATTDVRVSRGLFMTCASYLAYTAGIHFGWRCTPHQLFRALIQDGGEVL